MSNESEVDMQYCEYCQEYVPVEVSTGECTQGCNNPLCPYDVFDEGERVELNFNDNERDGYEELNHTGLVEDSENGC